MLSGGIWIIAPDGTPFASDIFWHNSFNMGANISADGSQGDKESEASTDGIDWEAIRLSAVYWEYDTVDKGPNIQCYDMRVGKLTTSDSLRWAIKNQNELGKKFAVLLLPVIQENSQLFYYKYAFRTFDKNSVALQKCFQYFEDYGLYMEEREVKIYSGTGEFGNASVYRFTDEFVVSYLTVEEIEALRAYVEQSESIGLCLVLAPCFLQNDDISATETHPYYRLD